MIGTHLVFGCSHYFVIRGVVGRAPLRLYFRRRCYLLAFPDRTQPNPTQPNPTQPNQPAQTPLAPPPHFLPTDG